MRRVLVIVCCMLGWSAVTATADGAGGPVPPQQAGAGAGAPGSDLGFVAVSTGRSTLVERVRRGTGTVERDRLIAGSYGVPGVAYDGSTTGVSADGDTLVLAEATRAYPVHRTRLVVLSPTTLRPRERIALPGWWTVDAISPDGRWLYLIHYTSVSSTNHYEVRAYDLRARRLLAKPVVDPREPDEKMQGLPITRTVSTDGRWAYTLYQRPDEAPFIHALDTQGRTAACIDLDDLTSDDVGAAHLVLTGGGATLRVDGEAGPLAVVDTRTFAVRRPAIASPPRAPVPARRAAASRDDGGLPWELALVALVPLLGLAVVVRRRRGTAVPRH
jgi:hypothetical protein